MKILQLKCLLCVCVTVKIQFDNTSTCKYSIILKLRSVTLLPRSLGLPLFKNSGSAPVHRFFLTFILKGPIPSILVFHFTP